jgi:hypothetical protein
VDARECPLTAEHVSKPSVNKSQPERGDRGPAVASPDHAAAAPCTSSRRAVPSTLRAAHGKLPARGRNTPRFADAAPAP